MTAVGLLFAVVGGLTAIIGTYYLALRDQFTGRRGAMQLLEHDLEDAGKRIRKALDSGEIWPRDEHLTTGEWTAERKTLASHVSRDTWNQFQALQERLDAADRRADELRAQGSNRLDDSLRPDLEVLATEIERTDDKSRDPVLAKLDRGIKGAWRWPLILLTAGLAALVVGALILWPQTPTWTSDSLASALKTRRPNAQLVVCDSSTTLNGAYTCAARFASCPFDLTTGQTCSPPLTVTYWVLTNKTCYVAMPSGAVEGNGDPRPSLLELVRRFLEGIGCKKI